MKARLFRWDTDASSPIDNYSLEGWPRPDLNYLALNIDVVQMNIMTAVQTLHFCLCCLPMLIQVLDWAAKA